MKKLMITFVAVMSVFLFISSGAFAENTDPEPTPTYANKVYKGLTYPDDSTNAAALFSENSNRKELWIAFNGEDDTTKVDVINSTDTAWKQNGEAVDPLSADAVVIYDKNTDTLTLSDYRYQGEGYFWQEYNADGYAGIYANNLDSLTIRVKGNCAIDLDENPTDRGNSIGILGNGQTNIKILGAPGAELNVQHGATGPRYTKSGGIMVFGGLSVETEGDGTPFKLVCKCTEEQFDCGFEFYGLYAVNGDIDLTNIALDIESASKVESASQENSSGHSIGIAAAGTKNSVNITGCSGTVKGGGGVMASEAIHCGCLNAYVSGVANNLTVQNSSLKLIAGAAEGSSYALAVLHKAVIDSSIITLETDSDAQASYGMIQGSEETAELVIKNQTKMTISGKDGAIIYDVIEKKELDFSEYGENLKVKAGANKEEAVLLENPQDCVGHAISYVHIYAQKDAKTLKSAQDASTPEAAQSANPATGIDNSNSGNLACAVTFIALAAGCFFCYRKKRTLE